MRAQDAFEHTAALPPCVFEEGHAPCAEAGICLQPEHPQARIDAYLALAEEGTAPSGKRRSPSPQSP